MTKNVFAKTVADQINMRPKTKETRNLKAEQEKEEYVGFAVERVMIEDGNGMHCGGV